MSEHTIALQYAGSPDISRPGWPSRDIDTYEIDHLAAVAKTSREQVVDAALATGLYRAIEDEGSARNDAPAEPELASLTKAQLLDLAAGLSIDLGKRPTNAALVEAIDAEQKRLAEETAAAAAEASSSGEGESSADAPEGADSGGDDQGGSEPADDPGAAATGEAGTPPSSEPEA